MKLLSLAWISAPLLIALAAGCTTAVGDLNDEEDALEEQVPTDADGANLDSEADGGAGGGPTIVIECSDESPSGTSGTCEPADDSSECQQCVAAQCCEEQSSCNSSGPDSACGFGSTLYNGAPVDGGEIGCMMECFAEREESGTFSADIGDLESCAERCGASECGDGSASETTKGLASCIIGLKAGNPGCTAACGF